MESEIRPDLEGVVRRCNRFIIKEKVSFLSANGLVIIGVERPSAIQVELLPGLFRFVLLPILIVLYVYMASRVGAYIGRLSRSYARSEQSEESDGGGPITNDPQARPARDHQPGTERQMDSAAPPAGW